MASGVTIVRLGNFIAARYNKAEALDFFMESEGLKGKVDHAYFVDDNSDNVFNVFAWMANQQAIDVSLRPILYSCWYPPPKGGKDEDHDEGNRELIKKLSVV